MRPAAVALVVSGRALLAAQETTLRAPADMVAGFYGDAPLVRRLAGGLLQSAGFVLLLPFAVALTDRLSADGATGRLLPATALGRLERDRDRRPARCRGC